MAQIDHHNLVVGKRLQHLRKAFKWIGHVVQSWLANR